MTEWPHVGIFGNGEQISPNHPPHPLGELNSCGPFAASAAVWPSANQARYLPFLVFGPVTAQKCLLTVSVQSGNLDIGIYDENKVKLTSSGATTVAAAGPQVVDFADIALYPGLYWVGMACDNGTASFNRVSSGAEYGRCHGAAMQATAYTLPATATFATPTTAYWPDLTIQITATL